MKLGMHQLPAPKFAQQQPAGQQSKSPAFEAEKAKRESHIGAHEQAHFAGLGHMAASGPVIERDGSGMPTGGHVQVKPFSLNPQNPEASLRDAQAVFKGASAPGADMSGADGAIAAKASKVMFQAQQLIQQKRQPKPQA